MSRLGINLTSLFTIKLLDFNYSPTIDLCNLCVAMHKESFVNFTDGFLLNTPHPCITSEVIYVSKICKSLPSDQNWLDVINWLDFYGNKYIAFCNMLNRPSIPNHWHLHFVESQFLNNYFVNYYQKIIKKYTHSDLTKLKTKSGIFYLQKIKNLSKDQKLHTLKSIYQNLTNQNSQIIFSITNDYVLIANLNYKNDNFAIRPLNLYGYFYTTKKAKYQKMLTYGLNKILPDHTQTINLKLNMLIDPIDQIIQILKNPTDNLASKLYSTIKLDPTKIKITNVYKLPAEKASDIQIQYINLVDQNLKADDKFANTKYINIACEIADKTIYTEQNRTEQNRTEQAEREKLGRSTVVLMQ